MNRLQSHCINVLDKIHLISLTLAVSLWQMSVVKMYVPLSHILFGMLVFATSL